MDLRALKESWTGSGRAQKRDETTCANHARCTMPQGRPRRVSATAHAEPAIAVDTQISLQSKRVADAALTSGTHTSNVKMLAIKASSVAARRGMMLKKIPTPAAMCAAPVR